MAETNFKVSQHQLYISYLKIWMKLVRQNNGINKKFIWKYVRISLLSLATQPFQMLEKIMFDQKVKKMELHPSPIFILGHWRSGTTHLHYLLTCDPQFGYLTNYQAFLFNVSLLGGKWLKQLVTKQFPVKRPMDNMVFSPDLPAEEELPFSDISTTSAYHSMWFPKNDAYFQKYALFENPNEQEVEKWRMDYRYLLQKIAFSQNKSRLVLKNPFNTVRIEALLKLFPDAKFIYIHRHPYDVYQSTLHWYDTVVKTQFLQPFSKQEIKSKTIRYYKQLIKNYLEQRSSIPNKNLVEIRFEDLETNPIGLLHKIYDKLQLGDIQQAEPKLTKYLNSIKNYRKNKLPQLDENDLKSINNAWGFAFTEWDYALNQATAD